MITRQKLKAMYKDGHNILQVLRGGTGENTESNIRQSYDLQAGKSLNLLLNDVVFRKQKIEYCRELVKVIKSLCVPKSIMEAGVGDGIILAKVAEIWGLWSINVHGFDISPKRIAVAKEWLWSNGFFKPDLRVASLFNIPYLDSSIDVVYTSHSIEPNGGNEEPILKELYRVAKKYLILLEPAYELASQEARDRMDSHGYCKGLKETAEKLKYNVIEYKLFVFTDVLNPTGITVIKKEK